MDTCNKINEFGLNFMNQPAYFATPQMKAPRCEVAVVIPVYNEEKTIAHLISRLVPVLDRISSNWEILFVNDGSEDATLSKIQNASTQNTRICCVSLSRNFGKEIAIAAGLDASDSDAVILMDADLQHPPQVIEEFIAKWRDGYDVVYGERENWHNESRMHRLFAGSFYYLFRVLSGTRLPRGAGDFRLMNRKAVDALRNIPERQRFTKGLYSWIGFNSIGVRYHVDPRHDGVSRFNFRRLFHFAIDGLVSFSIVPLRMASVIGLVISLASLAVGLYSIVETLFSGVQVPGYATLVVSVTFLSGVQLLFLGVIGEYIGRIYTEVKRRPLYFVERTIGLQRGRD